MAKKISTLPAFVKVGAVALLVAGCLWSYSAWASSNSPVVWDEAAAEELAHALHAMHDVWNTGDIAALKQQIIGDDVLVTFELDPETHQPIRLDGKQDLDSFVDNIVTDIKKESAITELGHPLVRCRVTGNFGVCTEECSVSVKMPNGVEEKHSLLSTALAVRYDDGWKWIQWHMSVGAPVKVFKDGELVAMN
jgi:hypothetical protein